MSIWHLLCLLWPPLVASGPLNPQQQPEGLLLVQSLPNEVFTRLQTSSPHRVRRDGSRTSEGRQIHNLRIQIFYDDSLRRLPASKRAILKETVLPTAVAHWQRALRVTRPTERILLNRKCKNNQYFISQGDDAEQFCKEACVKTKCGEYLVPEEHLKGCKTCDSFGRSCKNITSSGPGVRNTDFILYVSSIQTNQCEAIIGSEAKTVAYAAHCQQESSYDRPVAGHTNICPELIMDQEDEIRGLINTIKHELLHALGFSSSLFGFWRDPQGVPRTPRNQDGKPPIDYSRAVRKWSNETIVTEIRNWRVRGGYKPREFSFLVTPRVVAEARDHFGCPSLRGVEMEDQGGDGTALTHWEKRIFHNEAMTGTVHTDNPLYSRISFALMEDTGWYKPVYEMADNITWGKGFGCAFLNSSCLELLQSATSSSSSFPGGSSPFCSVLPRATSQTDCSFDRSAVGNCNLLLYKKPLPRIYQNFEELEGVSSRDLSRVGSSVALADFCPYIQEFNWSLRGSGKSRGTICTDSDNQPSSSLNFGLETYGKGSICLQQSRAWVQTSRFQSRQLKRYGSGCYRTLCANGTLYLSVLNQNFPCGSKGELKEVSIETGGYSTSGNLICPSCDVICGAEACF